MLLILLSVLGILIQNASANTSSCRVEDLINCRNGALRLMSGSSGSDAVEQKNYCRELRENFDCMVWQTSMCYTKEDQDSHSDVIMKTWTYLQGFCERYGNWWASPCFQRDDIKRCESLFPSGRNSLDSQSCSMFLRFRDCVSPIVGSSCSSSDRKLLGTYYMEKGQQMAWRCPRNNDHGSLSASSSAQQLDRRHPEMYGDTPSSDTSCFGFIINKVDIDKCVEKLPKEDNFAAASNDESKKKKPCCDYVDFKDCLQDLVKKCPTAEEHLEKAASDAREKLEPICKDYTNEKCKSDSDNSAVPMKGAAAHLLLCLFYSMLVKKFL